MATILTAVMKEAAISRLSMRPGCREIAHVLPLIRRPPVPYVVALHQIGVLDGCVSFAAVHGLDAALDLYEGEWRWRNLAAPHALRVPVPKQTIEAQAKLPPAAAPTRYMCASKG